MPGFEFLLLLIFIVFLIFGVVYLLPVKKQEEQEEQKEEALEVVENTPNKDIYIPPLYKVSKSGKIFKQYGEGKNASRHYPEPDAVYFSDNPVEGVKQELEKQLGKKIKLLILPTFMEEININVGYKVFDLNPLRVHAVFSLGQKFYTVRHEGKHMFLQEFNPR
ncbi:MAG TPA: hypothetical protein PKD00_00625 [Burkholderiales bacterium]|nr:hypothetical protein [Burkholderiales bacterium]